MAEFFVIALLIAATSGLVAFLLLRFRRANWGAVVLGNVALFILFSSVILLGFEIYFRFLYNASDGDNRTRVSQQWFERHWSLNNLGLRDSVDYSVKMAAKRRRLTFVGDSFTAGHGLADVEARFTNRLRKSNPDWDVHALAHPGLETTMERRVLRNAVEKLRYEIDVVVLVYYMENITTFSYEAHQYFVEAGQPPSSFWSLMSAHSFALDLFYHRWRSWQMKEEGFWTELYRRAYAGSAWKEQREAFGRFRRLVLDHGGCFAVVSFPTLANVEPLPEIRETIDAHWKRQGVPHLSLFPVFEPHASSLLVANSHDGHPNAFAHGLAAAAIQEFLDREVFVGSEPRVCPE